MALLSVYHWGLSTVCSEDFHFPLYSLGQWNVACVHYVMVSKFQWKPFWLATQRDPQNDWTATQNRVNYDVFAQAPLTVWRHLMQVWLMWIAGKHVDQIHWWARSKAAMAIKWTTGVFFALTGADPDSWVWSVTPASQFYCPKLYFHPVRIQSYSWTNRNCCPAYVSLTRPK